MDLALFFGRPGVLPHLRDDMPGFAWPGHWSLLGGGCDPGETAREAVVRELAEEAGLVAAEVGELFEVRDEMGSGQLITFFRGRWNGDPATLPLSEGVELRFFAREQLDGLLMPPYIRAAIERVLASLRRCHVPR